MSEAVLEKDEVERKAKIIWTAAVLGFWFWNVCTGVLCLHSSFLSFQAIRYLAECRSNREKLKGELGMMLSLQNIMQKWVDFRLGMLGMLTSSRLEIGIAGNIMWHRLFLPDTPSAVGITLGTFADPNSAFFINKLIVVSNFYWCFSLLTVDMS